MKKNEYAKFWFEKPEESVGFLLWQITNLWQRKMNAALKDLNLTHVQFALLAGIAWLERFEKPITQVRLAKYSGTNIMMTSKVIRTLEKKGFILREECEADTRAKCISLTKNGIQRFEKALNIVRNVDENIFENKTYDTDFIMNLVHILELNQGE
ncbi:MarR family winged helix-turn-helix transcriptional regulator [Methanobacterium sp.]|uniref:MarR family winged helix-turn-helix transcriptional regulator n=1 Tax=Methanobacterium sp. TaxID=2164 RepID=UPI003C79347E